MLSLALPNLIRNSFELYLVFTRFGRICDVAKMDTHAIRSISGIGFRRMLMVSTAALIAYTVVAEVTDFALITVYLPGTSKVAYRLSEGALLWALLWSVGGWFLTATKRMWDKRTWTWVIASIPALIGLLALLAQVRFFFFPESQLRPSSQFGLLDYFAPMIPFVQGIVLAIVLLAQAQAWQSYGRSGKCCTCGYDLTGNLSGTCPECGDPILRQGPLMRHRHSS